MNGKPLVSIVIPCLRERQHIRLALDSIVAQDYPQERLEVLVVDGMSEDGTREIVEEFSLRYPFIRLLDNPKKITPAALNVGIQKAQGQIIVRMDAHSTYETDYVTRCERALNEGKADVVGGVWRVVPESDSVFGRAVALALSHPFGVGSAYYRIGRPTEQKHVDAVPFGSYWKELFGRIGMFNEDVPRSEDVDFYRRVRAAGGDILLVPTIVAYYRARSNFSAFLKHSLQNGFLVTYFLRNGTRAFYWRHLVPLVFVSAALVSAGLALYNSVFVGLLLTVLGAYLLANIVASLRIAVVRKEIRWVVVMPVVFSLLHCSYGLGSLWGLVRALGSASRWRHLLSSGLLLV